MRELWIPSASRPARSVAALAVIATFALLAAACGGDDDDSGGGDSEPAATGASESAPAGASGELSIAIESPADGAEVPSEFEVRLSPSVEVGEPGTGLHHVHLFYDGKTAEGEYDMVFGPSAMVTGLEPGEHTIEAVIANADHSLTDARATVTVTVTDAAAGGTGEQMTIPGYGY